MALRFQQFPIGQSEEYDDSWSRYIGEQISGIGNTIAQNRKQEEAQRRQALMDRLLMEKFSREGQEFEREGRKFDYEYGKPFENPDEMVGMPMGQMGSSSMMPGGLPKNAQGPRMPVSVGQGMPMIEAFNKFRAGGMRKDEGRPEFMDALGQDERKQYYKQFEPEKPSSMLITPYQQEVLGLKKKELGLKEQKVEQETTKKESSVNNAYDQYQQARLNLTQSLSDTMTGPIVGLMPPITSKQQMAEGSIAMMAPILKQLFRSAGEGIFTDKDQELLLKMVPDRKTNPEAREFIFSGMDRIIKAKLGMEQGKIKMSNGNELYEFDASDTDSLYDAFSEGFRMVP